MPKRKPFVREGMPTSCIVCRGALHRKSEHYCSKQCEAVHGERTGDTAPPFRSKWKERQHKRLRDPLVDVRQKARQRTRFLLKQGRLRKQPCVVCGGPQVVAHHEDYRRPGDVIWLCDTHHKEYHDGAIGLFGNQLWWNPNRLIPKGMERLKNTEKYRELKKNFNKKRKRRNG